MCVSPDVTPALSNYSPAGHRKFPGGRRFTEVGSLAHKRYSKLNTFKGLELCGGGMQLRRAGKR
jgi:hypothetical protein